MPREMENPSWPKDPYKGLANYECDDKRLFAGRDAEIDTCAQLLANAQTKLLVLHGQTGCGKSSFLRAGLIPALEEHGTGYLFLRRPSPTVPGRLSPSFIRCGADPLARIAEEIFLFAEQPLEVSTANGRKQVDLRAARLGIEELETFVTACADPHQLFLALERLTAAVPHTLVLILDQVEEIITLNSSDKGNRLRFSRFIKEVGTSDIDMRFVLAIRKDHSGQFIESVQVGSEMSTAFRTFFLTDLSRDGIRDAILRPTLKTLLGDSSMPGPFEFYQFEYAPGVVDRILDDLDALIPAGATLPVMQIVCRDLYEQVLLLPKPRLIEMQLYQQGGIKGRVKRHLKQSLRDVLMMHNVRGIEAAQTRWLRVLKRLVQEEGDGRVHTNVVPRSTLINWAAEEGIEGKIGPVIEGLAEPKVLVMRRFSVFAPGAVAEHEMFCLGHDMVGIALRDALRDAEQAHYVNGLERKRLIQAAVAFSVAIGAIALFGLYVLRADSIRVQKVSSLLAKSSLDRSTDLLTSLAEALQAQSLARGGLNEDARPNYAISTLLAGLPVTVAADQSAPPLLDSGAVYPTFALRERVGLATLRSQGVLNTYSVVDRSIQKRSFITPEPLIASAGKLDLQSLQFSDSVSGLLLAFYEPQGQSAQGGVIAFPHAGLPKLFRQEEIANVLRETDKESNGARLLGLSGDTIVMFSQASDNASMRLAAVRVTDSAQLVPVDTSSLGPFPNSSQIDGQYVVSYFHPPTEEAVQGILTRPVITVSATDLSTIGRERRWEISDFKAVKKCRRRNELGQRCDVTAIPDLQQPGIIVLGLWEVRHGRYASYPRGYISDLLIIDLNDSTTIEVNLQVSSAARQNCSVAGGIISSGPAVPAKDKSELNDDDVPTFVAKSADKLLFGYTSRTSAQLINVSSESMSCSELFIPKAQVDAWRPVDHGEKLLGLTRDGGFVWNLHSRVGATTENIASQLAQACTGQLKPFALRFAKTPAETKARTRLLGHICQNDGT